MFQDKEKSEVAFEEALSDDWVKDLEIIEVPLTNRPLIYLGATVLLVAALVAGRIIFLNLTRYDFYVARAGANANQISRAPAPRGLLRDRHGRILAENEPVFVAVLDLREFVKRPETQVETLRTIRDVLSIPEEQVKEFIAERTRNQLADPIVLDTNISRAQVVRLKSLNAPAVRVVSNFQRKYSAGQVFSTVVGYTGITTAADLERNPQLVSEDFVGKAGVEMQYDDKLRGAPGVSLKVRDARGEVLVEQEKSQPRIGESLFLTLDAGFQEYFYERMRQGLISLDRTSGAGLAVNPQTGEVLALISFPTFDNNLFVGSGKNKEKLELLNSPLKPLFNRAVSGQYTPGSTIKPLVGIAALTDGVINPARQIFSPGYLDVPNPYDPNNPTRFLDWRYQGEVNLAAALAQSSNVYFYTVGGGAGDIGGLGINRLRTWWQRFRLGEATGIDLPGEQSGFLPSIEWKESRGSKWRLGDTYNVSIGQGDLLLTPIQLLTYIAGIAVDGKMYKPFVVATDNQPRLLTDLSSFLPQIREVQKGMRLAVTSPLGTAYKLHDLPFAVAAKTGSSQVENNTRENAFFAGYAPAGNPQIAILILVEHSQEGSLNAVPIARDVLNWYYEHRLKK